MMHKPFLPSPLTNEARTGGSSGKLKSLKHKIYVSFWQDFFKQMRIFLIATFYLLNLETLHTLN